MKFGKNTVALIASLAILHTTHADSIYDIAAGNEDFTTLVAAVDAAGLTEVLSGEGNFTVFAPPNDAFDALPEGTVAKLLEPEWVFHLQDVLKYHTLGSVVMSTDLSEGLTTPTLNTENIVISLEPTRITTVSGGVSNILVNDGLVDIQADNGVIHGVDAVFLPTSATSNIVDIAVGNEDFSTLVAALTAAGLVDALSGEGPFTVFGKSLREMVLWGEGIWKFYGIGNINSFYSLFIFFTSLNIHVITSKISTHKRCIRRPPRRNSRQAPSSQEQSNADRHSYLSCGRW